MQLATVKWHDNEICTNILLETSEDVFQYQELLANNAAMTVDHLFKSKIPVNRWDHFGHEGAYGNPFNMAVQMAKIEGGRPLFNLDRVANEICVAILKQIMKGDTVLINKVGGWCPYTPSIHEIIEVKDFVYTSNRKAVIKNNTKYINLENDHILEKRTKDYLGALDQNFSFILCLREYSERELVKIFEEFSAKGGQIVYVYTTGSDVAQMWEYSEAIIKSGLKVVEFEFNAGYTDEHKEVVEYLQQNQVSVTLITQE